MTGSRKKFSLDALNAADAADFAASLAGVFEHSPWVIARACASRPFAHVAALHAACMDVVFAAPEAERIALVRAHPDLAGKAARAGALTAESAREQAGAGLDRLSGDEFDRFHRLNDAYRDKFGWPFVICVRHHDKSGILDAFERRLGGGRETELAAALAEIGAIARLRLADLIETDETGADP